MSAFKNHDWTEVEASELARRICVAMDGSNWKRFLPAACEALIYTQELRASPKLYCGECDRYERDPIFLDVERCSKCGEQIEATDND